MGEQILLDEVEDAPDKFLEEDAIRMKRFLRDDLGVPIGNIFAPIRQARLGDVPDSLEAAKKKGCKKIVLSLNCLKGITGINPGETQKQFEVSGLKVGSTTFLREGAGRWTARKQRNFPTAWTRTVFRPVHSEKLNLEETMMHQRFRLIMKLFLFTAVVSMPAATLLSGRVYACDPSKIVAAIAKTNLSVPLGERRKVVAAFICDLNRDDYLTDPTGSDPATARFDVRLMDADLGNRSRRDPDDVLGTATVTAIKEAGDMNFAARIRRTLKFELQCLKGQQANGQPQIAGTQMGSEASGEGALLCDRERNEPDSPADLVLEIDNGSAPRGTRIDDIIAGNTGAAVPACCGESPFAKLAPGSDPVASAASMALREAGEAFGQICSEGAPSNESDKVNGDVKDCPEVKMEHVLGKHVARFILSVVESRDPEFARWVEERLKLEDQVQATVSQDEELTVEGLPTGSLRGGWDPETGQFNLRGSSFLEGWRIDAEATGWRNAWSVQIDRLDITFPEFPEIPAVIYSGTLLAQDYLDVLTLIKDAYFAAGNALAGVNFVGSYGVIDDLSEPFTTWSGYNLQAGLAIHTLDLPSLSEVLGDMETLLRDVADQTSGEHVDISRGFRDLAKKTGEANASLQMIIVTSRKPPSEAFFDASTQYVRLVGDFKDPLDNLSTKFQPRF